MTCHTRFQAASISKMVFTLSVPQLAAGNKISLNDGISKYLDDIHLQDSNGLSAKATVRQILSHTAGFGIHGFDEYGHSPLLILWRKLFCSHLI